MTDDEQDQGLVAGRVNVSAYATGHDVSGHPDGDPMRNVRQRLEFRHHPGDT